MTKRAKIAFCIVILYSINSFASSKTVINADSLSSNKLKSKISARGNVQLTRDNYKVYADEVLYDNKENKIYLKNKTKLIDTENNNIFADEGVITDDMMYGEFKNAGIILSNGISIVSPNITKENDDRYLIGKSHYYFCPNKNLDIDMPYEDIVKEIKENKKQIFTMSSKKSVIDKSKNKIYLNHVFINFFNIPIFYIPYISTSRPFNDGKITGISSPSFSKDSDYGYSISLPYYFYGKSLNYKLDATFFQYGNILLENKLIFNNKNIKLSTTFNYAFDNNLSKDFLNDNNISEANEGKYNISRFYYNIMSEGFIDKNLFFNTNINVVNDIYFLRDYYNNYDKFLKSNFDITKIYDNSYITFNNVAFQEIREKQYLIDFEEIYYVPSLEFYYDKNIYDNNGLINTSVLTNIKNIFNNDNNAFTNFYFGPKLSYSFLDNYSNYFELNTSLNIDTYNFFNKKNINYKDEYRINPEIELKTILPFYYKNFSIKAKIQYFWSDYNDVNIMNLDTYDSEITINNLFSNNRYNGYNIIEKGNRINYGLESDLTTKYGYFNFTIGQGYRDDINNEYKILNFDDNLSNILTGIYYKNDILLIHYLGNINKTNYNLDRTEILLESYYKTFTFSGSYVKLLNYYDNNYKNNKYTKEEQLNFYLKYNFNRYIFTTLNVNTNIEKRKITLIDWILGYEDECFKIEGSFRKSGYIDSANDDSISFNLNLRLKAN